MAAISDGTKLVLPGLAGFYDTSRDIAYALVRITIGYILLMHGWAKVAGPGLTGIASYMSKQGLEPGMVFASAAIFLETVGAACIIVGLFTRFFAAALAIELGIAFVTVHWAKGFSAAQGGFEYVLLLGVVMFAIALRGGGPYSIDHLIGREL